MDTTSEYTFPIFISSTDYNLKDFRAELGRFLKELGYHPVLSSAEGFPDNSPNLEPWESCITVLNNCFVMVLVIDGKYGTSLPWPNLSADLFGGLNISPTHGEYHFAHNVGKRMLVFIRKEVMTYYQSYRKAYNSCGRNDEATKEILERTLPNYIEYETLKFIHQVKTTKPIPWIKEFDDITDVKKEVQKKMLNELAEIFLIKEKHLQTVIDSFNKALDTLSLEEQRKILRGMDVTKSFVEAFEKTEGLIEELEETKSLLENVNETNVEEKENLKAKIKKLEKEKKELEKTTLTRSNFDSLYLKNGKVQIAEPIFLESGSIGSSLMGLGSMGSSSVGSSLIGLGSMISGSVTNVESMSSLFNTSRSQNSIFSLRTCDGCGKTDSSTDTGLGLLHSQFIGKEFNDCQSCKKHLCKDCWPNISAVTLSGLLTEKECPKCKEKEKTV